MVAAMSLSSLLLQSKVSLLELNSLSPKHNINTTDWYHEQVAALPATL
jgi:hypothetical protein